MYTVVAQRKFCALDFQLLQNLGNLEFAFFQASLQLENLGLFLDVLFGFDKAWWVIDEVAQELFLRDLLYIREAQLAEKLLERESVAWLI